MRRPNCAVVLAAGLVTCLAVGLAACLPALPPFAPRPPFTHDTDLDDVSVPCRRDAQGTICAPTPYVSPFLWDQLDNHAFARVSHALALHTDGEAANANSLDEVADSAWFTNPSRATAISEAGACKPEDLLPVEVADGAWIVDHGKDNGSSLGFRVVVPGKGRYMLKADDRGHPEQSSAASVIGAAFYAALGFNTTCEQIVTITKAQLTLKPGLHVADNGGVARPFDGAALERVLASATQLGGGRVRMQASKWLAGVPLGPFRYEGTRADDPNDIIDHADRRELRGGRVLAAWLNHWDAREQNSMDVWIGRDGEKTSPGHVLHHLIDTSDAMGALGGPREIAVRLGYAYNFDVEEILRALITLGIEERPWDRAQLVPGHAVLNYFRVEDFDPGSWKGQYPNPAFLRMSERDGAWMARQIARFSEADIRRIVALGKLANPRDAALLSSILVARQQLVLARYLTELSPLGELHTEGDRICATDFARLRALAPASRFHYAIQTRDEPRSAIAAEVGDDGAVCFAAPPGAHAIAITNGVVAAPIVIYTYGKTHIAGVTR